MKRLDQTKFQIGILTAVLLTVLNVFGQGDGGATPPKVNNLKAPVNSPFASHTIPSESLLDTTYLDPNFGTSGLVTTDLNGGIDFGWGLARQSDGKILACGGAYNANFTQSDFAVVRYNANGTIDTSFGTNGKVITNIGTIDVPSGQIAIQPDGKIVVGGYANGRANGAIVRYNSNGTLDTTFGTNGIVTYALGNPTTDEGKVLLQNDGKIVFIGIMGTAPQTERQYLVRLNTNGSFDTTFGTNGLVITSFGEAVARGFDGVILPDGKILAFGWTANFQLSNSRVAIARYNSNGTLDTTFNNVGYVLTGVDNLSLAVYSGFVQPDGKIVVSGRTLASPETMLALRYNADGTLDTTFGGTGILTFNSVNRRVAGTETLYANGKIYISGWIGLTDAQAPRYDFLTVRLNLDGSFDTTFGQGGSLISSITNDDDQVYDLLLQPNGQLLITGYAEVVTGTADLAILRLKQEGVTGKRQADFDDDGKADVSVYRPTDGNWFAQRSLSGFTAVNWGIAGDKPAPADYDGDGKTDYAVFRENGYGDPNKAYFFVLNSYDNTVQQIQFGRIGDDPSAVGDWDGDGKADAAVFRGGANAGEASNFYFRPSSQPGVGFATVSWGISGDKPVSGDFDGDGRSDAAVFRPSNAVFYVRKSSDGLLQATGWGLGSDKPLARDFDGDGKADVTVFRNGTWYILQSATGQFRAISWGLGSDTLVPADYDGDGKADAAVYRGSVWYLLRSSDNQVSIINFGASADTPVPGLN